MRLIDADALMKKICGNECDSVCDEECENAICNFYDYIMDAPTIESEQRHGRWIECDYKHMEHGMIETEPKAGLCCSECRTAFQKKKMTYKQYCAACGAKMYADGGTISKERLAEIMGGADNG